MVKINVLRVTTAVMVLSILMISGIVLYFTNLKTSYKSYTPPPRPPVTIIPTEIVPTKIIIPSKISTDITFPHENLPGFNLNLPTNWNVNIKQFGEATDEDYITNYTDKCSESCMGVQLSQENVSLNLVFDVAFDSNGVKCSNTVEYKQLNKDWYRVKDSKGYFYSSSVSLNHNFSNKNGPFPYGSVNDEWSVVPNTDYNICVYGFGEFLKEYSPYLEEYNDGGSPILLEFPRIKGNPTEQQLNQLDSIISSITGLHE
jgi:hypothetical protein